ncbi:MAG: preprotein translocase subunit YajC [Synergistaceae bacterium]|nr:preprotein translocase subunit YajC [Synergistaceae bacterium]
MQKQAGQGGIMGMMMPLAIFIVIFYFLILRPQKKRQQEHDKLVSNIKPGDTVVTAGGFYGKVHDVLDDSYIIELDQNVKARILKSSISSKIFTDNSVEPKKKKKRKRPIASEQAVKAASPTVTPTTPQAEQAPQPVTDDQNAKEQK